MELNDHLFFLVSCCLRPVLSILQDVALLCNLTVAFRTDNELKKNLSGALSYPLATLQICAGNYNFKLNQSCQLTFKILSDMNPSTSSPHLPPAFNIQNYYDQTAERQWQGPFSFIVAADPQFGLIERFIKPKPNPGWAEEVALTSAALRCVNGIQPKPKFLVVNGDMCDAAPVTPSQTRLREDQYEAFLSTFQGLDKEIPLVCTCGNHDIGDDPTLASHTVYRSQFGRDFYDFWIGGVKFIVLNSQYFKKPNSLLEHAQAQLDFIKEVDTKGAVHTVVLQHIPFFIHQPEEDNISWINIDKPLRLELLELLERKGVNYIFTGHCHRNGGGLYKNIDQVVTSALGGPFGPDPSGFRICHVTSQGIHHHYVPVVTPEAAKLDENVIARQQ